MPYGSSDSESDYAHPALFSVSDSESSVISVISDSFCDPLIDKALLFDVSSMEASSVYSPSSVLSELSDQSGPMMDVALFSDSDADSD